VYKFGIYLALPGVLKGGEDSIARAEKRGNISKETTTVRTRSQLRNRIHECGLRGKKKKTACRGKSNSENLN